MLIFCVQYHITLLILEFGICSLQSAINGAIVATNNQDIHLNDLCMPQRSWKFPAL